MVIVMVFTTMTCNPNWHEIQENLKDGETPLDRPDLVAFVVKLKRMQLIRDLGSEMIFGKIIARTHSIEYQKRGFPYMYIISWLEEGNRQKSKALNKVTRCNTMMGKDCFLGSLLVLPVELWKGIAG